jgi:hypothetical protein
MHASPRTYRSPKIIINPGRRNMSPQRPASALRPASLPGEPLASPSAHERRIFSYARMSRVPHTTIHVSSPQTSAETRRATSTASNKCMATNRSTAGHCYVVAVNRSWPLSSRHWTVKPTAIA